MLKRKVPKHAVLKKPAPKKIEYGRRGGWRPGGGRPKGSRDAAAVKLEKLLRQVLEAAVDDGKPLTALQGYQAIYRNPDVPFAIRERAMSKAMPHESPQMKSTEHTGPGGGPIEHKHRIENARASLKRKLGKKPSES